jgi:hypothetical protein
MEFFPLFRPTAYLDPGSGSYLLQLLVAAILGGAVAVRMNWARLKGWFSRKDKAEASDTAEASDRPDES